MLGGDETKNDTVSHAIVQQFLSQFVGDKRGVIYKHDFIQTIMKNRELLVLLSPFYGADNK